MTSNAVVVSDYTRYARALRQALLNQCHGSTEKAKDALKHVFSVLDDDGDGVLTVQELRGFLSTLVVFGADEGVDVDEDATRFSDMLIRQFDVNHDNKISHSELAQFLWPPVEETRELGVVIAIFHQAFVTELFSRKSDRAKAFGPSGDDEDLQLLKFFAAKVDVKLLRGNMIETNSLKKAFSKLMCVSLGLLSHREVDMLLESLDANGDGVITAREFKQWLVLPTGVGKEHFQSSSAVAEDARDVKKAGAGMGAGAGAGAEQVNKLQQAAREKAEAEARRVNAERVAGEEERKRQLRLRKESEAAESLRILMQTEAVAREKASQEKLFRDAEERERQKREQAAASALVSRLRKEAEEIEKLRLQLLRDEEDEKSGRQKEKELEHLNNKANEAVERLRLFEVAEEHERQRRQQEIESDRLKLLQTTVEDAEKKAKQEKEAAAHEKLRLLREAKAEKLRFQKAAEEEAERLRLQKEADKSVEEERKAAEEEVKRKATEEEVKRKAAEEEAERLRLQKEAENADKGRQTRERLDWHSFSEYTRAIRKSVLLRHCGDHAVSRSVENINSIFGALAATEAGSSGGGGGGLGTFKRSDSSSDSDIVSISDTLLRHYLVDISSNELLPRGDVHGLNSNTLEPFVDLLLQQIDIDHTGSVTIGKMANFLWPVHDSEREVGVVLEIVRKSMLESIGDRGWRGDEFVLMELFANKNNIKLLKGDLMDVRALRIALTKSMTTELQLLSTYEIDSIIGALDVNGDNIVSPAEFKSWLLFVSPSAASSGSATATAGAATAALTH
jgi:Ca2+-binding EF-hand superfamily protein